MKHETAKGMEFPVQLPDLDIYGLTNNFITAFKTDFESVRVLPNPANEYVNISTHFEDADKNLHFMLYDINGKPVKTSILNGTENRALSIKELAEGMYYYVIKGNDKVWHKDKLLIIR